MREVVIVSAVRTPIGSFGGGLAKTPAVTLGALVIREAIERAGITPDQVDQVIMGNVLQAGLGQNPARQAAIAAGDPHQVPSWTLNMVCGSGLKTVQDGAQAILAGDADVVVAGGMESMSLAPYVLDKARTGYHMGNATMVDTMINDGLWDAFNDIHMGITAENVAAQFDISRQDQDAYSVTSQNRAEAAIKAGTFTDEIVPVVIPQRKGDPVVCSQDEFPRFGTTLEALGKLRSAFSKDGTVTAGNASGINDGAAALVVMSKDKAAELGLTPLATIVSWASAGVDPKIMGTGPIPASRKRPGQGRTDHRGHGPRRSQRSLCLPDPRSGRRAQARHGQDQRQRRRDRPRPPDWRQRRPDPGHPLARNETPGREARTRDPLHRRWTRNSRDRRKIEVVVAAPFSPTCEKWMFPCRPVMCSG